MRVLPLAITVALVVSAAWVHAQPGSAPSPRLIRPQEVAIPIDEPALQRQYAALSGMNLTKVTYNEIGLVHTIKGTTGISIPRHTKLSEGDAATAVIAKLAPILLLTGTEAFKVRRITVFDADRERDIVLDQSIGGVPVMLGWIEIRVNDDTGEVVSFSSRVIPDRGLPRTPKVTAQSAKKIAAQYLEGSEWAQKSSVQVHGEPQLAYFADTAQALKPTLIWALDVSYMTVDHPPPAPPGGNPKSIRVFVDAMSGEYLDQITAGTLSPTTVYSANNVKLATSGYPQGLTRLFGDGQPQTDARAIAAYQNAVKAKAAWYNFSWKTFRGRLEAGNLGTGRNLYRRSVEECHLVERTQE